MIRAANGRLTIGRATRSSHRTSFTEPRLHETAEEGAARKERDQASRRRARASRESQTKKLAASRLLLTHRSGWRATASGAGGREQGAGHDPLPVGLLRRAQGERCVWGGATFVGGDPGLSVQTIFVGPKKRARVVFYLFIKQRESQPCGRAVSASMKGRDPSLARTDASPECAWNAGLEPRVERREIPASMRASDMRKSTYESTRDLKTSHAPNILCS